MLYLLEREIASTDEDAALNAFHMADLLSGNYTLVALFTVMTCGISIHVEQMVATSSHGRIAHFFARAHCPFLQMGALPLPLTWVDCPIIYLGA